MTEIQVYSKLYYETRLKEKVDEALRDIPSRDHLAIRLRYTQEAYTAEPPTVKQAVRQEMKKLQEERDEAHETLTKMITNGVNQQTPVEYAKWVIFLISRMCTS